MALHTLKGHEHIQGSANTSEWITCREWSGDRGSKGKINQRALQALMLVIKCSELRTTIDLISVSGTRKNKPTGFYFLKHLGHGQVKLKSTASGNAKTADSE